MVSLIYYCYVISNFLSTLVLFPFIVNTITDEDRTGITTDIKREEIKIIVLTIVLKQWNEN